MDRTRQDPPPPSWMTAVSSLERELVAQGIDPFAAFPVTLHYGGHIPSRRLGPMTAADAVVAAWMHTRDGNSARMVSLDAAGKQVYCRFSDRAYPDL